jgi:hypothetical protein
MGLLDPVKDPEDRPPAQQGDNRGSGTSIMYETWSKADRFGDPIYKKPPQVLRIGYQNIGGLSFSSGSVKDDVIRTGLMSHYLSYKTTGNRRQQP